MKIGSLFSGAGGLDLAVHAVFGGETLWHCEIEPAASKVLAARWPGVPNHVDITTTVWADVESVDILCGGWPCQPFSLAGKRNGADDERALWPYVARAVRMVRPRIVVLENVSAVLGPEFQRVANDLAACGYDIAWTCLRASDVGAPHRRERLFVVAVADGAAVRQPTRGSSAEETWSPPSDGFGDHCGERVTGNRWRAEIELLPTPTSRDHKGQNQRGDESCLSGALLPTPAASDGAGGKTSSSGARIDEPLPGGIALDFTGQWGRYEPAIRRWESLTRPAPSPTESNTRGNPRLSARFSEWMMGWPAGWVTDVPGISRNDALRIIGNGVVPQCAAAALRWLLSVCEVAA